MIRLTLLTRPNCHLCDQMKEIIWQTQQSFTFLLHELDITSRKDLETKYGTEIPVLMYGTRVVARTRVTAKKLGEQLRRLKYEQYCEYPSVTGHEADINS